MKPDRGLDWLNLCVSAAGSAYGAFLPVYLLGQAWTQTRIGLVLTVGTVASVVALVPAGMLIDARPQWRRKLVVVSVLVGGAVPLMLAAFPRPLPVGAVLVLQALVGAALSPAIAAVSLSVAGRDGLGERLGRNARYGCAGAGLGAAILGLFGALGAPRGVFLAAAAMTLPGLWAARRIGPDRCAEDAPARPAGGSIWSAPLALLRDPGVLRLGMALALFQVASIAVLQLAATEATRLLGTRAGLAIAALTIVPQIVAAWAAPGIGRMAERFGHRKVLLWGFATVPVRGAFFAVLSNPWALVPVQVLEGAGGATFGIMMPLLAADLTKGTGFYTSCLGLFGLFGSLGTAISTALAGWTADRFGREAALWVLAAAGVLAVAAVAWRAPKRVGVPSSGA